MTPHDLRTWIAQRGLTQRQAAELLAMPLRTLQDQLLGEVCPQTELIVQLLDHIHDLSHTERTEQ